MRTVFWVVLVLVAGCKSGSSTPEPVQKPANAALAARLEAFGKDDSKANLDACLNALRTANLFVAVKPNPSGAGGQAAIKVDEKKLQVLYAFLDEGPATVFWQGVEGLVIQKAAASSLLEVATFEQADLIVIDPHQPDRSLVIPRDNYAPIAAAWGTTLDSGTLH